MRLALPVMLVTTLFLPCIAQTVGMQNLPGVAKFVAPPYPRSAKDQRIQGIAVVRITVSSSGQVTDAKTVSSHPVFENYVLTAVKEWKFKPGEGAKTFDVTFRFAFYEEDKCRGENGEPITPETFVSAELPSVVTIKTGLQCIITSTSSLH